MNIASTRLQPIARYLAQWILGCLLAIGLAACGGGDDTPSVPTITSQPTSTMVNAGDVASFHVTATGGEPLSYQWQKNGTPIEGATATNYTTPVTSVADTGALFTVVVSNASGTVTSNAATLTVDVLVPPTIATQPMAQSVVEPQAATFTVSANGSAPLSYQWSKNGVPISGGTAESYTTPATALSDTGALYAVAVTNAVGTATSAGASLTVSAAATPPVITTQPVNQAVNAGQTATFIVAVSGTAPIAYQWSRNGAPISGATTASYTTPPATDADSGAVFSVVATNPVGNVKSADAGLTVTSAPIPPAIATSGQPGDASVVVGQAASFSVIATGSAPLTYQWQRGGIAIAGATNAAYTTPATTSADNGTTFSVVVRNAAGSVLSRSATLTLLTTPTAITQIDSGPAQSVALERDGTVLIWGDGGYSTGDTPARVPQIVKLLGGGNFTDLVGVSAGSGFTLTVKSDGTVWGWGNNSQSQLADPNAVKTANPIQAKSAFGVPLTGVRQVEAGQSQTGYAIKNDGSLWAWGYNGFGEMGDGTTDNRQYPVQVLEASGAPFIGTTKLAGGGGFVLARKSDGSVWSWGYNLTGKKDALGTTLSGILNPEVVESAGGGPLLGVVDIAAGQYHAVAVTSDGRAYAWGTNTYGALCNGNITAQPNPTYARDSLGNPITGIVAAAAGWNYTLLLKSDGTVLACGYNVNGELGDGSLADYQVNPVTVRDATGQPFNSVRQISLSNFHAMAIRTDGTVWTWGGISGDQLGDPTSGIGPVITPTQVPLPGL